MTPFYPTSFASVRAWAAENRLTIAEARERFVQFAILRGIASSPMLRDMLVFKGGNALDFIWQPNRSTHDLDFSADMSVIDPMLGTVALGELLKTLLADALTESAAGLDLSLVVHRVKQQPPGA